MEDSETTPPVIPSVQNTSREPSNISQKDLSIRSQNILEAVDHHDATPIQELLQTDQLSMPAPTITKVTTPPPASPISVTNRSTPSPQLTSSPTRISKSPQPKASVEISLQSETSAKRTSFSSSPQRKSPNKSGRAVEQIVEAVAALEPKGKNITENVSKLAETFNNLVKNATDPNSPYITDNIDKITNMSRALTNEASALRQSINSLTKDIEKTKQNLMSVKEEDVNFPYHLFLVELIINKIHMKCDCFDFDFNNLVISATFLGKQPIVLYDPSYGRIDNFSKVNVGKSTLFAMTYDKICSIKEFEIVIQLTKQPPCTSCVTKIGETRMDYTKEFIALREELCTKWLEQQPNDNIVCTTSTPLSKNLYYLSCGDDDNRDSIGVIQVTTRMSFLGKEITTTFCTSPQPQGTSFLLKKDNGMTMYSCHKVEMDDHGKILLDESSVTKKTPPCNHHSPSRRGSPMSQLSPLSSKRSYEPVPYKYHHDNFPKYDEIFTKMNANELKIRVPKSSKVDRIGKYDKIQELCACEETPYNTGDQIQFELPRDLCNPDKTHNNYSSNLKYTYNGCDRTCDVKDRKIINVTPLNCPVPVAMEKEIHPLKDVFILKIGKKLETKDKKTDLEIELVTPKSPHDKLVENKPNISQQCSSDDIKKKTSGTKKKEKGKAKAVKSKKKGKKTKR
ncbi:uncharacterized protein LOC115447522 [Manduca sexta]|uniref:uncharacterized protein LOC115447522 n=1 Tax=Manduca sexta TaxID=7130 RepID=UPI0011843D55|nr:uncharacterized protein LOC115447522 [Manduca sexta]